MKLDPHEYRTRALRKIFAFRAVFGNLPSISNG